MIIVKVFGKFKEKYIALHRKKQPMNIARESSGVRLSFCHFVILSFFFNSELLSLMEIVPKSMRFIWKCPILFVPLQPIIVYINR